MIEIHKNIAGFFYDKLQESQVICELYLGDDISSYIMGLLTEFHIHQDLVDSRHTIADEYYMAMQNLTGTHRNTVLRLLGDVCLMQAGLFPELARKRGLGNTYYNQMGRTCYESMLSPEVIYDKLAIRFDETVFVLNYFSYDVIR